MPVEATDTPDRGLLAPTPRVVSQVALALDDAVSPASSTASTPSANSSTSILLPPPPASPARVPVAPLDAGAASSHTPSSSSRPLFRYSESDDDPVASTSYSRGAYYPPKAGEDSEDLDDHDWDTGNEPLMEGLVYQGLRRASLDLRGEERRLKEMENEAEEHEAPPWLSRGGGVWAGIANMSNSILGAGIIGLPYALREAGFVSGIILLVVLGIITDWTIRLIVLNAKMSGRRTFIDILDSCFGRPGRAAASFFQFAFAFGGMCAFCVILGDTIPRVLLAVVGPDPSPVVSFFVSRQVVTTVLTLGISYPLSLYRDIEKLSHASALALVSMVVIVVSVGVRGPGVDDSLKGEADQRWTVLEPGFFEAIGVISFAFVCHHNSLLIYGSLRTPTLDRFARITHVSTTLSVIACLCMSTSGFLVFTNRTQGNILNNFAEDDTLINIARACFGANMFATLPLEAFVCREVAETYFWPDEREFNKKRHVLITSALVFSALLVSLITCDLGFILELAGGFSATALAYLFPAACFLRLSGTGKQQRWQRVAAWACVIFGIAVMVLSTFLSIRKALAGGSHKVC
ncbi:Avt2p [Rhodotorula paludigena]|uniref:Avt2p n=1 Tax=Rhodotorula paludigena TaxID=86838 RepID=UPI0031796BE3